VLSGEYTESYESADDRDADDLLRAGGDRDGVLDGARDEPLEDAA